MYRSLFREGRAVNPFHNLHARTYTHTYINTHAHAHAHAHMHTRTYIYMYTHACCCTLIFSKCPGNPMYFALINSLCLIRVLTPKNVDLFFCFWYCNVYAWHCYNMAAARSSACIMRKRLTPAVGIHQNNGSEATYLSHR